MPERRIVAALRAQHPRLLLRLADVQDALASLELAQIGLGPLVLAFEPLEADQVDPLPLRIPLIACTNARVIGAI